jgi:peptidyl-prolyl cis-trans isomerase C
MVCIALVWSALVLADTPPQAQSPEPEYAAPELRIGYESERIASWGDAILTRQGLMAFLEVNVPPADRAAFLESPERIERLLRDLMTPRVIAADGLATGLLDDPVLKAETYQAAMNFLSEKQLDRIADERELDDYEAQARELYLRDPEAHRTPETVDFTHLLIREDDAEVPAEDRIRELAQRVAAGESFEVLVVEHSEDPSVERNQGSFEGIADDELDPNFVAALDALEPGEISEPVRTQFGWHLIRLDARNPSTVPAFEDISARLIQQARRTHRNEIERRYANALLGQPLRVDGEALNALIDDVSSAGGSARAGSGQDGENPDGEDPDGQDPGGQGPDGERGESSD